MLEFSGFSQIITLFAVTLQQAGAQSFVEPVTNSLNQFATTIGQAAPKIVAALILLGIGLVVGRVIGWVVRKVAQKMNLDRYWSRTGIGESVSRAGWNLTRIISVAARWFVYLFFISAAVNVLEFSQLSQAINNVWLWIPNVAAFIIILVIGSLIADFVGRWMQRELPARGVVGGKAIGLAATGILYAIVLVVATTQLQIGEAILNSVISALIWGMAAAIAIGVGVGLAYGLKEAFPAMIRGTTQIQPTLKQGQRVTIGGMSGTIQEAGSFSVILKDDQGKTIVIPTKNILDKEIVIESGPPPAIQEKAVEENRGAATSSSSSTSSHRTST
ncbi:MAG TPA: mechanosensitive ion channel domain-containing protein [Nitrososphaeraceae archaeon]|nr:mechanosensitive ion channel domain-containing protein [Nitrososphaeraceae archaeon]